MALAAAQVIDALAARIVGATSAAARVYTSRAWPLDDAELPAWRVFAEAESVEQMIVHPDPLQLHDLDARMHGYVRATADLDDAMHALTAQALAALFDTTPPADALTAMAPKLQLSLRRIERAMQAEGQASVGRVAINLSAKFRTRASAPETLS